MNKVEAYLDQQHYLDRLITFDEEIATVATAASQLKCSEGEIAKSLTFKLGDEAIMIVMAGDTKVDNAKYRNTFHEKARMLDYSEVEEKIGHPVGGVCPFALKENTKVYLDISLKRFDIVYPAAGQRNNCIKVSVKELEELVKPISWVDISKIKEEN